MNIKIGILNVPKHDNKHDLIHFVTILETQPGVVSYNNYYDQSERLVFGPSPAYDDGSVVMGATMGSFFGKLMGSFL